MKSIIKRIINDAKIDELADKFEDDLGRIRVNQVFDFAYAVIEEYEKLKLEKSSALERYNKLGVNEEETSPIERLRVYCSLAMNDKDWLDVETFELMRHLTDHRQLSKTQTALVNDIFQECFCRMV